MGAVTADFPDTAFAIVDDASVEAENLTSLVFAEHEGSFLVGAAAALTSETGQLGFIGGVEVDLIEKFEAGFVAGAAEVAPDAPVVRLAEGRVGKEWVSKGRVSGGR